MKPDLLDAESLRQQVDINVVGRTIEHYGEVSSTNTLALERAADPTSHGLAIFAEYQTAGRGRLHHTWLAPRGASVLCSVVLLLEPNEPQARSLVLWTALAVRQALLEACNVNTTIKWPNDLLAGGRKIAGILIESKPLANDRRSYVVGIGINCLQHGPHFPPEIRKTATSLDLESTQKIDRMNVAKHLLEALDHWYEESAKLSSDALRSFWAAHALPLGKRLRVRSEGQYYCGSLIELDPQGGILMQLERGGRRLFSPHTTSIEAMDDL